MRSVAGAPTASYGGLWNRKKLSFYGAFLQEEKLFVHSLYAADAGKRPYAKIRPANNLAFLHRA